MCVKIRCNLKIFIHRKLLNFQKLDSNYRIVAVQFYSLIKLNVTNYLHIFYLNCLIKLNWYFILLLKTTTFVNSKVCISNCLNKISNISTHSLTNRHATHKYYTKHYHWNFKCILHFTEGDSDFWMKINSCIFVNTVGSFN